MMVTFVNFKMRLIFVFVVFVLIKCNVSTPILECDPALKTIGFTYLYDQMDMTAKTTDWLSRNIDTISNKLANNGMCFCMCKRFWTNCQFQNGVRTVQSTLETLLQHLRESRSYSVIFVVTYATEQSNGNPIDHILEEIQNKRTQVNFIIGTETLFSDNDSLREYKLIASISNGFILGPEIFQSDKFTDEIYLRLAYQPQVLRLFTLNNIKNDVSFCTDAAPFFTTALKDLKFRNCSGKEDEKKPGKPRRSIMTNLIEKGDGDTINEETVTKECSDENPGNPVWFNYIGFTSSDYDFDYGFTIENVVSLDDTYRRPINGMTNKIYVSLTDKNFKHGVDHFKIRFLNETQFGETIAMEQIQGTDLFIGSFDPPNKEYFYVEVTSYVNKQTIVTRISSTAVNAAEGFGDDHGNRIFDHRPIFKCQPTNQQPVASKSYDNNYDIYYLFIGVLLGLLLVIVGLHFALKLFKPELSRFNEFLQWKCHKCSEQDKKLLLQQRLKDDKDRHRAASTDDRV